VCIRIDGSVGGCAPEKMTRGLSLSFTRRLDGKPKGVVTARRYLLWCALTHKYVFDIHDGDVILHADIAGTGQLRFMVRSAMAADVDVRRRADLSRRGRF